MSSLAAAADERKARLAQLKQLKRKHDDSPSADPEAQNTPPKAPTVSGRNYDPETRNAKLGFENAPTEGQETVEDKAARIEAEIRDQSKEDVEEQAEDAGIDLFSLQPKKPNWDLKQDLERRLEALNVKTDNAIAQLVRERIGAAEGMDLVEGVRARERE